MNLGCVLFPWPATAVITVTDGTMENEIEVPHVMYV